MTANEGRARLNLPAIQDDETADALVLPLNQQTSGAGGAVQAPTNPAIPPSAAADPQLAPVLEATWARQWQRLEKLPADLRVHCFDISRWDKELAADLQSIYPEAEATALAERINTETLRRLVDGAPNPFVHRGELHGEPFLRA
jgi:hypothetical protein